jgi:hypothetical protein
MDDASASAAQRAGDDDDDDVPQTAIEKPSCHTQPQRISALSDDGSRWTLSIQDPRRD